MFFEGKKIVDNSFVMAVYLVANPDTVVRVWERGAYSYFRYSSDTGKFYHKRPTNKYRKDWYEARGLKSWFDTGISNLFAKDLPVIDLGEELPF